MKRIVWTFGDGSVQFSGVDQALRLEGETEEAQIERIVREIGPSQRVSQAKLDLSTRTEAERLAYEAVLGDGAKAVFVGIIDGDDYQAKRLGGSWKDYREAWTWDANTSGIAFDPVKGREIKRAQLRELRAPKLAALDTAYMRADETGNVLEKERIAAEKQKLRDVTADLRIEAAQTPEQLKTALPDILK